MDAINPAEHFDRERAEAYDRRVRILIPGYDTALSLSKSLLETVLPPAANLLVAGAGTGNEAALFASDNPGWKVTGFDPSPAMIEIAKSKVAKQNLADRVSLVEGFADSLPEKPLFDAATSILVMHFLPDDGSKDEFVREISKRLKPRAKFVLADLEGDPGSGGFRLLAAAWKTRLLSASEDGEGAEETFRNIMKNVKFAPESRIREILAAAGFEAVGKFHQSYLCGGYIAEKSGN